MNIPQRIAHTIQRLESQVGERITLIVDANTEGIDLVQFLSTCSNDGMRSLNKGQVDDCRFSMPDGSSLHMLRMPDGSAEFHMDLVDPRVSKMWHLVKDTVITETGLAGSLVGGLLGGVKGALMGTAIGAWVGAKITGSSRERWWLTSLDPVLVSTGGPRNLYPYKEVAP